MVLLGDGGAVDAARLGHAKMCLGLRSKGTAPVDSDDRGCAEGAARWDGVASE
uniref:Uncharacterized protein n=1 Tax=Arundo donax TaxID=35708 RepID=A0A0A8ZWM2_ARUDO